MEDADWHGVIGNHLHGTANTVRTFARYLVKNGEGRLLLIPSTQGQSGTKNGAAYSASKIGHDRPDEVGDA